MAQPRGWLYARAMTDHDLLEMAFGLADEAGAAILAIRSRGFETRRKADASVVTEADHAAEALIVAALRAATPEIPVVAEEEIAGGHEPRQSDAFWLVDPLDGTRGFAVGGDDFAVCIGLVRGGRPVLGVVGVPATGELFGAVAGQPPIKRDGGGQRRIAARLPGAAGLSVMVSQHSSRSTRLVSYLEGMRVAETLYASSALKFCRVAEGAVDLYPRFGPTMEWDTAAGQAILEAAGGSVVDAETGLALGYGKPGFRNSHFIAAGRR